MTRGNATLKAIPLVIGAALMLSACATSPGYVAPAYGYAYPAYGYGDPAYGYPAYGSLQFGYWGGWDGDWHRHWDHHDWHRGHR
ncbi:MAG TPA: hypothetical protein VFZ03_18505 [Dongiaceae bacterium]